MPGGYQRKWETGEGGQRGSLNDNCGRKVCFCTEETEEKAGQKNQGALGEASFKKESRI